MKQQYFRFDLVLAGNTEPSNEIEDALYEAGCDDASILYRDRTMYMMFTRLAANEIDAITSAVRDVRKADHGLSVVAVLFDPNEERQQEQSPRKHGLYMITVDVADEGSMVILRSDVDKEVSTQELLHSLNFSRAQLNAINKHPAIGDRLTDAVKYLYKNNNLQQDDAFLMYLHYKAA